MDPTPTPGRDRLYETAPCGLMLARADGTVLDANATAARWLRRERNDLLGTRLGNLLTSGGRIFWHTHLQPLLRMQGSVAEVKLELRCGDGATIPVMVNVSELAWEGTPLLHIALFVAEDRHRYERELLAQRRRAEELAAQHALDEHEIAAARAQAEDRAQFAEQLVAVVSHDIRNPLSVIQMSTVLLQHGASPQQQEAALTRVGRAVKRVQHLISDLLDFSQARLGSGISIRKAATDLHQAVADGVGELAIAFPNCKLRHERSGPGDCVADADRIVQAVGNLVANAANHGAPGEPITIRTAGDGTRFRIGVHNRGKPIAPEVLPRLFEPMVRGAQAGPAQGVGLGLFIVRAIATAHGGAVHATSTEADGTEFTIELPRS
jgi:phosphoserine phosphatase RsbU/P